MKIIVTMNVNERSYIDRTATKIASLFGKTYDPSKYWRTEKTTTPIYTSDETITSDGDYTGIMNIKSEFIYDVLDITAESISKFYTIGNQIFTLAKAIGVDFKGFGQSVKTRMKKWVDEEKVAEKYNSRFYMRARKMAEKSAMRVMQKDDMQEGTLYILTGISENNEWHTWTGTGDDFIEFATGEAKKIGMKKFHSFKAEIKHGSMVSFTEIEIKKAEPSSGNPISGPDELAKVLTEKIGKYTDGAKLSNGMTVAEALMNEMDLNCKLIGYAVVADIRDDIFVRVSDTAASLSGSMVAKKILEDENLLKFYAFRIDPIKGTIVDVSKRVSQYYDGNFGASHEGDKEI